MTRRKGVPQPSALVPPTDSLSPVPPPSPGMPRSASPSSGFAQFLSKPKSWFVRSASASKVPTTTATAEARTSNVGGGGGARKHKISRPTDPRPILDGYGAGGSRSVLDLSQPQQTSFDQPRFHPPSVPSSPISPHLAHASSSPPGGGGLGDLRSISRKGWSRSADDLNQVSPVGFSPINTSFQEKIAEYRNRSSSNASMMAPSSPSSPNLSMRHPFPTLKPEGATSTVPMPLSASPPQMPVPMPVHPTSPPRSATLPTVSISVSAPAMDENNWSGNNTLSASPPQNSHIHTRSHSFTPKLPSKLSNPRFAQTPKRKGSASNERELEQQQQQLQTMTPTRAGFIFPFNPTNAGGPAAGSSAHSNRMTTLLAPPTIIEPHAQPDIDTLSTTSNTTIAPSSQNPKRSSQIVYHSSFINRLADAPSSTPFYSHGSHNPNFALAKGWKAYKMELKGTKLFFYKPSHDRNAGIKELFPTGLVPPSLEDEEGEGEGSSSGGGSISGDPFSALAPGAGAGMEGKGKGRDDASSTGGGTIGRKRRAFWGRRAHPDLVRDVQSGRLEKGTFEALTHEAVFATTFFERESSEELDQDHAEEGGVKRGREEREKRMEEWKGFASGILLSLPSVVGCQAFENEFMRCCAYLVSGAEEGEEREEERERVRWLANEYLKYHGAAVDEKGWEDWKEETIPDLVVDAGTGVGSPASVAIQDVFSSSPVLDLAPTLAVGGNAGATVASPNLGTFSPRPDNSNNAKFISLLDALQLGNESTTVSSSTSKKSKQSLDLRTFEHQPPQRPAHAHASRIPWAQLQEEGLSKEMLFTMDVHFVARSLTLFHRSVLDLVPENLTSEYVLPGEAAASSPIGSEESKSSEGSATLNPLFGNDEHPHWLTKLILLQILGADTGHHTLPVHAIHLQSPGRKSGDGAQQQTSRTHSRSEVISVWAKVGELCRTSGDECSWRAIVAALCSRPVARLEKVWKRVDPMALDAIEAWVYPEVQLQARNPLPALVFGAGCGSGGSGSGVPVGITEPRVAPWGGDVRVRIGEELAKVRDDQMLSVDVLKRVKAVFDGFRAAVGSCPRRMSVDEGEIPEDVKRMVGFWREMAGEGGGVGSLAVKFQRVEQFMSLSLAAEPRRRGLFEPHFWNKNVLGSAPHASLIPLMFPEALPSVTLVDRSQLIRGRVDSDASDIQYLRGMDPHLRVLQRAAQNVNEVTKRLIMGTGGTVISLHNGELLLVVQPGGMETNSRPSSRAPSRPPSSVMEVGLGLTSEREKPLSRAPSIRVKPSSSHGLERKTSMARRNSLPSLSQRQNLVMSERSSDPPLRVLVQAGTLSALVNILVHGLRGVSVSVADDNGEMTLREGMTRELAVDRAEFARVWWNVFRSFLTPFVFFELLRKMYITAQPSGSSPSVADYLDVLASRTRVLELISDWLTAGGGAQDVLDEPQLYNTLKNFLNTSADHVIFKTDNFEEPDVAAAWVGLLDTKVALSGMFGSQTKRPTVQRLPQAGNLRRGSASTVAGAPGTLGGFSNTGGRVRGASIREPPELDRMDADDLVDSIDGMARAALSNVTEEDLYVTADLLEVQTSDRTGWFSPREVGNTDEVVEIQNMYTHIQEVEPSSLISEMSQDALYRLLPPGIRSCIRAYGIIRKWLIAKLVMPKLGLRGRQARMELLLQAIEVARLRNAEPNASHHIDQPCVRSFVEAVITSAIISMESRMHQRPWQFIAYNRGCTCDSVAALLARPQIQSTNSRDCLTVDMGWLVERMLEVIASPDIVESVQDGQNLVNFDKRRHLCNIVSRAATLPHPRKIIQSDEATRRGFERLNVIEREVLYLQFDHRGIREESMREALGASAPPSIKKVARPFQKLIAFQMEKNRRDKNLRSRLQKEKQLEQSRNDRKEDMLNKAMRPRKAPVPNTQKQHRNKKSMSAFLSFMRPISSAFGADLSVSGVKKTAAELDFPTTGKPSLVLSVMDAKVAQFINNERSFTFQLDTEDGGHYILQAVNKREMNKWLDTINKVTSTAAKRRLTYLGPKPQIQDHIHQQSVGALRDPRAVFGVELEFLLQREVGGGPIPPGTVPAIIDQCLGEVESRGLTEVGIYRIAGAVSEINALKEAYNRGESPITNTTDIHAVCDLVKAWFRVLPEPVFPSSSYHDIMNAMRIENLEHRLSSIRSVVQSLPQANFELLKRVSEHLDRVTDYEEHNHMTAEALAIVFSPNLLRAPQNDFVTILNNMGQSHKLVKALITHFQIIFDEADPDAEEVHSEEDDDMESPILEEDEDEEEEVEPEFALDQPRIPHHED